VLRGASDSSKSLLVHNTKNPYWFTTPKRDSWKQWNFVVIPSSPSSASPIFGQHNHHKRTTSSLGSLYHAPSRFELALVSQKLDTIVQVAHVVDVIVVVECHWRNFTTSMLLPHEIWTKQSVKTLKNLNQGSQSTSIWIKWSKNHLSWWSKTSSTLLCACGRRSANEKCNKKGLSFFFKLNKAIRRWIMETPTFLNVGYQGLRCWISPTSFDVWFRRPTSLNVQKIAFEKKKS